MTLLERHADKWMPEPMSGCYLWTGATRRRLDSKHNFPCIWMDKKNVNLPALVLIEHAGERPEGHEVSHICGNCHCVNPDHLKWETRKENNARKSLENLRFTKTRKGFYFHKEKNKWAVQYSVNNKTKFVGYFETPEKARAMYLASIEKES